MAVRAGTSRTFTVSFPPQLAQQVDQLAAEESRTTSELFREAFRVYRAERVRAVIAGSNAVGRKSNPHGYQAEDVEKLVDEVRTQSKKAVGG